MRLIYIAFSVGLLGIVSCNNNPATTNATNSDSTKTQTKVAGVPIQSKLNDAGTQRLMSLVNSYYALKNALVATNSFRADSATRQLQVTTDSMRSFLNSDPTNLSNLKLYLDTIATQSKILLSVYDEGCEKKRLAFGPLSSAMYGMLKAADLKNAHVYQEYCPMAFNEKGAHWLSDDSDIRNPYFGKKMMECGEVTDVLK